METIVKKIMSLSETIGAWEYQEEVELTEFYDSDEYEKCKKNYEEALDERERLMHIIENEEEYRVCTCCGDIMQEGFCIEDGQYYYCTDECLKKEMSWDEYLELHDDGEGDSYWTQWY